MHGRGQLTGPLVFIGGITIDAIAAVARRPGPDERVVATASIRAGGGPAATAAVAAARLGAREVVLVGAVGDDEDGEKACAELAGEGVDVDAVSRVPGAVTASSVIVVDTTLGTRSICATPGPRLDLQGPGAQVRAAVEALRGARLVHGDHLGWAALTSVLDVREPTARPPVSADVSYDAPGFDVDGLDLYVPSLARDVEPGAFLEGALAAGAGCVVATRGAHGSVAACRDGRRASAPGVAVEVVSTLGAGDVFHGALLFALDKGLELGAALSLANAVAAASCRGLDGRSAIPRLPAHLGADALIDAVSAGAGGPGGLPAPAST